MKVINDNSVKGIDNGQDNQSETYYSPNINIKKILKGGGLIGLVE